MTSTRTQIILFGGLDGDEDVLLGDTWSWDGRFWTQRQDIGSPTRSSHRLAYDSDRDRVVLFGGRFQSVSAADTWELSIRPDVAT